MITIRDEQLAVFRQASLAGFEARVIADLFRSHPALRREPGSEALAELIRTTTASAAGLGLITESSVQRFVECAVAHGAEFWLKEPWAREIAEDPSLPPEEKLRRLESHRS